MTEQNVVVRRLTDEQLDERVSRYLAEDKYGDGAIWRTCRWCGQDIAASDSNHAYCDVWCKKQMMIKETG